MSIDPNLRTLNTSDVIAHGLDLSRANDATARLSRANDATARRSRALVEAEHNLLLAERRIAEILAATNTPGSDFGGKLSRAKVAAIRALASAPLPRLTD